MDTHFLIMNLSFISTGSFLKGDCCREPGDGNSNSLGKIPGCLKPYKPTGLIVWCFSPEAGWDDPHWSDIADINRVFWRSTTQPLKSREEHGMIDSLRPPKDVPTYTAL